MLKKELLEILICPQNQMPLALADKEIVDQINAQIEAGNLKNVSGKPLESSLDGGLVRADGKVLYPILDEIPVLLAEEGIELSEIGHSEQA